VKDTVTGTMLIPPGDAQHVALALDGDAYCEEAGAALDCAAVTDLQHKAVQKITG
jgi:hypothetical protein